MTWRAHLFGAPLWSEVLRGLLLSCGINSTYTAVPFAQRGLLGRVRLMRWGLGVDLGQANVVHHVFISRALSLPRAIHWRKRPQIVHWIGSDVLAIQTLPAWRRRHWIGAAQRLFGLHLAHAPHLAEEVNALGLPRPRVVPLLPDTLRACPLPMPEPFAVLSYWSTQTFEFYRGDWVLRLAREFPSVPFYIVGRCTAVSGAPANVRFLGWVDDIAPWYERTSVLLRLPQHDGVSGMVLDMLARARHVIWSRPLSHCYQADTYEVARDALTRVIRANEPNHDAPAFVAREFKRADSVAALREAYEDLGRQVSG